MDFITETDHDPMDDLDGGSRGDLMTEARIALRTGAPINFLSLSCSFLTQLEVPYPSEGPVDRGDLVSLLSYVDAFIDIQTPETTALLAVLAVLVAHPATRQRCGAEVARRRDRLPPWLARLDEASVTRVVRLTDQTGDADLVVMELRLAGGHLLTFMVLIDHNLDHIVKQVGVLACSADEVVHSFVHARSDPPIGASVVDLAAADARVMVAEAIRRADDVYPPYTSVTWPACRPLLEMALGTLPAGGAEPLRVGWSPEQADTLAREFLNSPELLDVLELDDDDAEVVVRTIVDLAASHGGGDPMRWSGTRVGYLLLDLLPRTSMSEAHLVEAVPGILSAFVSFCGRERGVDEAQVGATLREVAELADPFRKLMLDDASVDPLDDPPPS
jgi:hypothetical protein